MKLHHIALTVKDLAVSLAFYGDIFGYKEAQRFRRDDLRASACFLQGDGSMLELWQFDDFRQGVREDMSVSGLRHIAFTDQDPALRREELIKKSINCGPLKTGASGGLYFFLSDPDDNQIEIYRPAL